MIRLASAATAALLLPISAIGLAAPASANDYVLDFTGGVGAYPRSAPSLDARTGSAVPEGTLLTGFDCYVEGEAVTNDYGYTSDFWFRDDSGSFWSEAWLFTGGDGIPSGVVECSAVDDPPQPPIGTYDPQAAANWAMDNYQRDERYEDSDCTWFVSSALAHGGFPQTDEWNTPEFDDPPTTAILADALFDYLAGIGEARPITWSDNTASGAEVGDVIAYDWDNGADGVIDHLAFVTTVDGEGFPSVTQHTPAQIHRYWSYAEGASPPDWIEFAKPGSEATLIDLTP